MASFGGSGLAGDWLSGGGLRDAVSLGLPDAGPKPVVYDWSTWTPAAPVHGIDDRPKGTTTFDAFASMMAGYSAKHPHASLAAPIGGGTSTTDPTSIGGDWAGVDRWNSAISSAASQTGVDPDLIKAVMKLESNGDPNAAGAPGVWGPMQVYGNVWGEGPWMHDANANILKGAQILKINLDDAGGNVYEALRHYHGIGFDGNTTDAQYADIVMQNYKQLKSGAGAMTGAGFPVGGSGESSFGVITGNSNAPISQGFGWTDFAQTSAYAKSAYGYTADYTTDRQPMGHAGIDVALNPGSALYSPVSGTVVDAGGTGYYCDADEGRCGPGAGELRIRLSNGDEVILGHMRSINVQVGQQIGAGQAVGLSGSENGGHVHVEYRKWVGQGVTNSGYLVVDPRQALGGGFVGATGSAGASGPLSPLDAWRQRTLGIGSGAGSPIATNDPLAVWRMTHVGG